MVVLLLLKGHPSKHPWMIGGSQDNKVAASCGYQVKPPSNAKSARALH